MMLLFRTVCLGFVLLIGLPVIAQSLASVGGSVRDEHGSAVVGARVKVSSVDVRFDRETVTDASGKFRFSDLAAGTYRVEVLADTFGTRVREVRLGSSTENDWEIELSAAPVAAEVSVASGYLAGTTESLGEIPGSIERIGGRELENARVFNFSEALRKIAGVNVRDEEGFGLRPNIGIRGTNPTRSTKVLLLEDGLPLSYAPYGDNSSYYHPPIERYESIEVLKGSGQIAYGRRRSRG